MSIVLMVTRRRATKTDGGDGPPDGDGTSFRGGCGSNGGRPAGESGHPKCIRCRCNEHGSGWRNEVDDDGRGQADDCIHVDLARPASITGHGQTGRKGDATRSKERRIATLACWRVNLKWTVIVEPLMMWASTEPLHPPRSPTWEADSHSLRRGLTKLLHQPRSSRWGATSCQGVAPRYEVSDNVRYEEGDIVNQAVAAAAILMHLMALLAAQVDGED